MRPVRVAVVGLGSAGALHARALVEKRVPGVTLSAVVCSPERRDAAAFLPSNVRYFVSLAALLSETSSDAVIIATPHKMHPEQTISALSHGLHVLCEKPAGVLAREARAMTQTARQYDRIYSLNLNRRTIPLYREMRTLIAEGRIGELRRVHWTSTSWLRNQAYYDTSSWRGTWAGEGGGLLVNQLPHILDLWQWTCGMPRRLRAYCGFGKYHAIEVEDEVCVFAEYANGATATLTASTGEVPGRERVEIVGSRGSIVSEGGKLKLHLMEGTGTVDTFIAHSLPGFPHPPMREETRQLDADGNVVTGITCDFVEAISVMDDRPLLAPGADGEASLLLANAILLSGWRDGAWVTLPMDTAEETEFERLLRMRGEASPPRSAPSIAAFSLEDSFRRL